MKQSKLTGYILAVFGMLMLSFTLIALKLGLESFSPIVTLVVSIILFGELVPPSTWMFAALIIGAVAWTQSVGRKSARNK